MFSFLSPDANKDEKDANGIVTPETIKARRLLAQKLMERATDTSPVQHWLQGAARLGQAFQGAVENYYTDKEEKAGEADYKKTAGNMFSSLLGGGGLSATPSQPMQLPSAPPSASPVSAPIAGIDDRYSADDARKQVAQWSNGSNVDVSGLTDQKAVRLAAFLEDNPHENTVGIASAFRSPERQAQLYQQAVAKYGSEEAARKWVSPPGKSNHNHGNATDLSFDDPKGQQWAHENASKYGLAFPMSHEPWHVELAGARGNNSSTPSAPTQTAQAAPQQNSQAMLLWANKVLNHPYASAGDKAIAQSMIQKVMTQEAKDPRDGVLKDLSIAEKKRSLGQTKMEIREVNGITYERPEGSTGQFKPVQSLPEKRDENTSDQKELNQINAERVKAGVPPMRLDEWKLQKGKASAPAVNIDQKQESEFGKETGKALAKRFDALATEGDEAAQTYQHIGELRRLGKNIEFGATASVRATLGNLGIKTEGVSDIEAFNTLINRLTPQQRLPGSGATSDFDAKMFKESLPRLMNTPQGNAMIMDTLEKISQNRMARGDIAMRVQMGELTPKEAMGEIRKLQQEARALSDQFKEVPKQQQTGNKTKTGVQWSVQ